MRKALIIVAIILTAVFIFSFTACTVPKTATETTAPETTAATETTAVPIVTGIEGRFYFEGTDEPIPDVFIRLNNPKLSGQQDPDLTIAETTTDSQGHYSFTDIVPGTYVISLSMETTETKVSSIEGTAGGILKYFEGASDDGRTWFIVELEIVVPLGEIVQEDFIVHK